MQAVKRYLREVLSYTGIALPEHRLSQYANITTLTLDSRIVSPQHLFLAVSGIHTAGHRYLASAASAGCILAFVDTSDKTEHGKIESKQFAPEQVLDCVYVHYLHERLADIAYCFYTGKNAKEQSQTSKHLPSITAITGTNGKTSVAAITAQLSSLCNYPSASIGTLGVNTYDAKGKLTKVAATINTTPDLISLVTTLADLQAKQYERVSVEASSHGLAQNRLLNVRVECAVFTNLTQDHLDYHGSMEAYSHAKRLLLSVPGVSKVVLNANDKESLQWQQQASPQQMVYWFSLSPLSKGQFGCWASHIEYSTSGITFVLHARFATWERSASISAPLIGAFNVANIIASITALLVQNVSFAALVNAAYRLSGVAGRMELFGSDKASILVDYAHTPDALKQALIAARVHTKGTLTCIFGCGGDRDTTKRSIMGAIAQQFADSIVLTQDNSRSEDPLLIIADIKRGMTELSVQQNLTIELDRKQAISAAWEGSQSGDMIIVAGKGHEDYMEINRHRIDYDEREVVKQIIHAGNCAHPTHDGPKSRGHL